ncbi:hypothetical protein PC110_g19297 [Phytophthora cactorum]|uniref:Uncharacterized protein n=2 Tax=Phytophthora cactorum TaxID=29920 RepID=A0A329RI57_9STRA|nr:hypothetical protein PC110_g19297 [Phytophthora cactorum]
MIWGALKNKIAMDPATSVADLGMKITAGLKAITKRQWNGAYKKVRKQEAYVEQQPPPEIAPAPTMEELQDLAGEATDKGHCSNIMGEMDTSA